jgi:hypothetical protein
MQTLYHGDSARQHNFFVYPKGKPLVNTQWDAYDPKDLCDNFVLLNTNSDGGQLYKCQGHPHQSVSSNYSVVNLLHTFYKNILTVHIVCLYFLV